MNIKTFVVILLACLVLLSVIPPTEVKAIGQQDILRENLMNRVEKGNEKEMGLVNDTVNDYTDSLIKKTRVRVPVFLFSLVLALVSILFFLSGAANDNGEIKLFSVLAFMFFMVMAFLSFRPMTDASGSYREIVERDFDRRISTLREDSKTEMIKSTTGHEEDSSDKNSDSIPSEKEVNSPNNNSKEEIKDILNTIVDKVNSVSEKIDKNSEKISNLETRIEKLEKK